MGDGDEQSGFAVMDVTQRLSDREAFLAETLIHINIHPCTSLNTLRLDPCQGLIDSRNNRARS